MNKQKLLLIAALSLTVVIGLWLLIGGFCIGRIENQSDGLWSQIHMYLTDEITVDFPITGGNQPVIFNYETGRGSAFSLVHRDDLDRLPSQFGDKYRHRGDGIHTGDTFTETFECWKSDGKNVNFYVENNGSSPVTITIDDNNAQTIPAGSSGHVSAAISAGVLPQNMTVKCVSQDESALNIYWKVAQRGPRDN